MLLFLILIKASALIPDKGILKLRIGFFLGGDMVAGAAMEDWACSSCFYLPCRPNPRHDDSRLQSFDRLRKGFLPVSAQLLGAGLSPESNAGGMHQFQRRAIQQPFLGIVHIGRLNGTE